MITAPVITLIGPEHLRVPDGMIVRGIKNLLATACPEATLNYIPFLENSPQLKVPSGTTHLIITGTPWIWHKCWNSRKYHALQILRDNAPAAKVLFLGIGACFPLGKIEEISADCVRNKNKLQSFFKDSQIIVRDPVAKAVLDGCDIPSKLLTCPAFYAKEDDNICAAAIRKPVLFFYDPSYPLGISKSCLTATDRMNYIQQQLTYVKIKRAQVYCVDDAEMIIATTFGLTPKLLRTTSEAFAIIKGASEIMSGRIHLAVPALSLRKKVILLPVDSRAETFNYIKNNDNDYDRMQLINELQEFFN